MADTLTKAHVGQTLAAAMLTFLQDKRTDPDSCAVLGIVTAFMVAELDIEDEFEPALIAGLLGGLESAIGETDNDKIH